MAEQYKDAFGGYYLSDLVQNIVYLKGKPFRLRKQPYFIQPYNEWCNPALILAARQIGKSIYLSNLEAILSSSIPFFNTLHVVPTNNQLREYSNTRLRPIYEHSPSLRDRVGGTAAIRNVEDKYLKNGSSNFQRQSFLTADHLRGISADMTCIDEMQDVLSDNIPVIEECLSASKYRIRKYCGTPKTWTNTLAVFWKRSTMNEWIIKCQHCSKHNIAGMDNIGKDGLICCKCKKDIQVENGSWHSTNPDGILLGFRIPQIIAPMALSNWQEVLRKLEYDYSQAEFYNSVLALPYVFAEKPLTEDVLMAACSQSGRQMQYDRGTRYASIPLYAGVDWGRAIRSYTVLIIVAAMRDKYEVVYLKRYKGKESDYRYALKDIIKTCEKFGVKKIGSDSGDAFGQNYTLREKFGLPKVFTFFAHGAAHHLLHFDPKTLNLTFNRTRMLNSRFMEIKNRIIEFPVWEQFKEFALDFLSITVEYRREDREVYYDHEPDIPDDLVHALNYAVICACMDTGFYPVA